MAGIADAYTADEVARAAGVPMAVVHALVGSGELPPLPASSGFFGAADILRLTRRLRARAVLDTPASPASLFLVGTSNPTCPMARRPLVVSGCAHVVIVVAAALLSSRAPHAVVAAAPVEQQADLVFLMSPGVGGGGGGSGAETRRPAGRLERAGRDAVAVPPLQPEPEPVSTSRPEPEVMPQPAAPAATMTDTAADAPPPPVVTAPVAATEAGAAEQVGVVAGNRKDSGAGAGTGGHAGSGRGPGNGEGSGAGLGAGDGGGTGGGPYRPGSGIQPPRLLREVKADYSEEARRRGITGDVVLEIVVRRDGRVGTVTVLRGLGGGLDERAVEAVRQWQFAAARRQDQPVDVIVEVAVEFSLR